MKKTLSLAALMALAGAASAQFTFPTFTGTLTTADSFATANLGAAPAGTYDIATITADYTDFMASGSFSSEALVGLGDGVDNTIFSDGFVFQATNGVGNGDPVTLEWTIPVTGYAGGSDFFFGVGNQFLGFNLNLTNISVTLDSLGPLPAYAPGAPAAVTPTALDLGVIGNEGDSFVFDTLGSGFDTELGLYDQAGVLITNNDDIDFDNGITQSSIETEAIDFSGLGAGTYYLALGAFNTFYGGTDFDATTTATAGGDWDLNIDGALALEGTLADGEVQFISFTIVPAPGAAALLGLAGFAGLRRRRA